MSGLYYKLHGVHRPVTMKKAVIKRRKRVLPVTQGTPPPADEQSSSGAPSASPPPASEGSVERGSTNADGSVNLGLRRRPDPPMALVPETLLRQNRQQSPMPSGDLTQYQSSNASKAREMPESLTDDNRLAPLTSITIPTDRQSSLSPASFLSPSRKRSFSSSGEADFANARDDANPKRLSSIKSILNVNSSSYADEHARGGSMLSPGGTTASAPSPGSYSNAGTGVRSGGYPSPQAPPRDAMAESGIAKQERRAALKREAERMREMLAAKERELAELD